MRKGIAKEHKAIKRVAQEESSMSNFSRIRSEPFGPSPHNLQIWDENEP